ncbi:S-adenosyl-L-methionine dependent methyltransferase [Xylogone sp. PMI_703]|nr:S-adenosyl-L-methionine dependent methyltransferase [Xylogone sp. PMI_703]
MELIANDPSLPDGIDANRPSVARMYDFYLGGANNLAVDRAAVAAVQKGLPNIFDIVIEGRAFLRRVLRYMCHQGIQQFLDIGSGLPSADNTHQVVQRVIPTAHVVYVDIDPTAVSHGREILKGNDTVTFIEGSALELQAILDHPETNKLIDFSKPVGVVMMGLVHFFSIEDGKRVLKTLHSRLAAGSFFSITHGTTDGLSSDTIEQVHAAYAKTPTPLIMRPKSEIQELLVGFNLVEPGLVKVQQWRLEEAEEGEPIPPETHIWYGVVVKV